MHRFRLRVGRLLGIPLWVHASWFLVLGLVVWAVTDEYGVVLPRLPLIDRLAMAAFTGLAFFACLAVHEVAHAVVARRFGVRVRGITLFVLGGVAEIEGELPSPGSEFAVALAAPATSIAIGSLMALLSKGAAALGWSGVEAIAFTLAVVNLGVAVFNLVPGLPLDGGRILRAVIWRRTGSFTRATRTASLGGRGVAACLVAVGIVSTLAGQPAGLWYVPMGVFIWFMARASGRSMPPVEGRALALTREGEAA
ncbi:MAG: site-2 protease family protein [Actinomycetota bacterium]